MNDTIQSIIGIIVALVVFVPAGGILFTLWRSVGWKRLLEDDIPRERVKALNHLADAIEHLVYSIEQNGHNP